MSLQVKIGNFDWRSTDELINTQLTQLNNFMSNKTLLMAVLVDEIITIYYDTTAPSVATKFKVYNILKQISTNGIPSTEDSIEKFLSGKTIKGWQMLDNGSIFFWYE